MLAVPKSILPALPILLALGLASFGAYADEDKDRVGLVNAVENDASIVAGGDPEKAVVGSPVHMKDELRTGPNGRLQVTFRDNTVLTLGEKASVTVDRYVYDPNRSVGETALEATKGAFRFASGKIKQQKQSSITVSTAFADIAVRGTEFWGGPIDGKFGVLLLKGEISVSNQAGSVRLNAQGQGTDIPSALEAPTPVKTWGKDKIARAVASVALH